MRRRSKYHQNYIYLGSEPSHKRLKKFQTSKPKSKKRIFLYNIIKFFSVQVLIYILYKFKIYHKPKKINFEKYSIQNSLQHDYENNSFLILSHICQGCGLLSHYNKLLSCLANIVNQGRIPIVNLIRFPNIFNGYNESSLSLDQNPWEYFFKQPFNYTLKGVKTYAKKYKNYECCAYKRPSSDVIFDNKFYMYYWNNLYKTYFPIRDEIINEADNIRKKLFKKSENVLGIFLRGTDFLALKPKKHYIQPEPEYVFNDVDKFDEENNYDYYFLVTEDYLIRNKFSDKYKNKLKYLNTDLNFNYNYTGKDYTGNENVLANNKNVNGNMKLMKDYIINIIILSKCIDIICGRANGSVMAFIITKGFRNVKAYNLGKYK